MVVQVVNMIPVSLSNETNRDSEPNVAVNPANPLEIAASAFTPDPMSSGTGPIFVSTDGGNTWALNVVLPGGNRTGDTTLRFATISNVLYAGILRFDNANMNLLRKAGFTTAGAMTILVTRANEDQPYTEAASLLLGSGQDRVYVGHSDFNATAGRTATVERSLNAATGTGAFVTQRLDVRPTSGQDGPPIRPAVHLDGTVYAAFLGWRSAGTGGTIVSDVVVVRDDNWASSTTPFTALVDSGDGLAGARVRTAVTLPPFGGLLGTQRVGSQLAIAVDPRDHTIVYVAWADGTTAAAYTIHVCRSTTSGQTWSADLRTVSPATNPCLAINIRGKVGFMYQKLVSPLGGNRWETHLELSDTGFSSTPTDLILANVPDQNGSYTGVNPIGDYAGLVAMGKNFYGVFSANNTPIMANFPQGVTYLRNVNWGTNTLLGTNGTTPVAVSIDPYFVRITEIDPADDFYVRDWTDNPSSGDSGLEPSTHPYFYTTGDVWNRRGTLDGGFLPNDQPNNEDAGNGAGNIGDNWAFARIRRNAPAASGAKTVTAHFLVSKLGTGSNFVDAGSGDPDVSFLDPDPTVVFNAAAVGPFVTPPCHWHLNPVGSTHLCLAVEISEPGDPYVPPSLVGNAPGWPTTDLRVINDNNKAQRNMGLSTTPARGVGGIDTLYGIAHNAAPFVRDMQLRLEVEPETFERFRDARIAVVGGRQSRLEPGGTITLAGMQPGENRWVGLDFVPPRGKEGEVLLVQFLEVVDRVVVNGFALGARLGSMRHVVHDTLTFHRSVLTRLAFGFGQDELREAIAEAEALLRKEDLGEAEYVRSLAARWDGFRISVDRLLKTEQAGDPFQVARAIRTLAQRIKESRADAVAVAHAALLNRLDSLLTMRRLANGDPADVLQNVRWQQRLYTVLPPLARLKSTPRLLAQSDRFIRSYGERRITNTDYPPFIRGLMSSFEETAVSGATRRLRLRDRVAEMGRSLDDLTALQRSHRGFLLALQTLERG